MPLTVFNIDVTANQIDRPFTLMPLATVGNLTLSLYICQGQINWHKHLDEDELFLVHEGVVVLETERGRLTLHSEELAVVPKGVAHRSSSQLRSVVVLLRPLAMTERKNGQRRHAVDTDPPLEKVRLARVATTLADNYRPVALARVEEFEALLINAAGFGPSEQAPDYGALWYVVRGAVGIEVDGAAGARLEAGELTVVPPGTVYRLSAAQPALLLSLSRADGADH